MNWKAIAMTAAKQAVNAALVTLAPMFSAPDRFNWHSVQGIEHMASLVGGAVLAREALVWVPKIMAWSQSADAPKD